jgi:phasin family protein
MTKPYSLDLRERVAEGVAAGGSVRAVAATFTVSVASVVRWSQRLRRTGSAARGKMGGHASIPRDCGKRNDPSQKNLREHDRRLSYWTAVKGVEDYNSKFIEFARANTNATFDFVQKMSGVKSPAAFIELWTEHARKQVETLTEQTKELAALAQTPTRATAEPLKTGVRDSLNRAA